MERDLAVLNVKQEEACSRPRGPVAVLDPQTHERYVLLRAEAYERLQLLFEHKPLSKEEQRRLLGMAGKRAGWDNPEMDIYNDLDPRP